MNHKTIIEVASNLGMDLEITPSLPGKEKSFRVYKGARQVFCGTEEAVRKFFVRYEKERPGMFGERTAAYME